MPEQLQGVVVDECQDEGNCLQINIVEVKHFGL